MAPIGEDFVDLEQPIEPPPVGNLQCLEPRALGFFSLNKYRAFRNDASQLGLIKVPRPHGFPLNMNVTIDPGFSKELKHFYGDYLDHLLRYMVASPMRFFAVNAAGPGILARVTIVCQMELLQEVMCTPYNCTENWRVVAHRYRNTSYMCLEEPAGVANPSQQQSNNFEAVLKQIMFHGGQEYLPNWLEGMSEYKNVFFGSLDDDVSILYDATMGGARVRNKL